MTPGPWEILIIVLVVVLLFGAKKLPDAARSIGRSMRIFKSEVKEMGNDDQAQAQQGQIAPPQPQQEFWDEPQNQPNPNYEPRQQPMPGYQQPQQGQPYPGQPGPQNTQHPNQ
ncbi:Sec-independent protein translocase subunit TatA [Corynebacterium nasicanis]|uniref:Sec-independent protein translocase protein TatA n=1 Tax=Corynebacterium nasicanis TaxID=1448267 RepID=A0ABW1QBK8_9CORY